jgi:hypothetical protein
LPLTGISLNGSEAPQPITPQSNKVDTTPAHDHTQPK